MGSDDKKIKPLIANMCFNIDIRQDNCARCRCVAKADSPHEYLDSNFKSLCEKCAIASDPYLLRRFVKFDIEEWAKNFNSEEEMVEFFKNMIRE